MVKSTLFRMILLASASVSLYKDAQAHIAITIKNSHNLDMPLFIGSQDTEYKTYRFCGFSVQLPQIFAWEDLNEAECDYAASIGDVRIGISVSGQDPELSNRDLFQFCVDGNNTNGKVTYQFIGDNFFVVSGKRTDGDIFYILRQEGKDGSVAYIDITYPVKDKALIEPHIGTIKRSLVSY
jgi:hypothetical protein